MPCLRILGALLLGYARLASAQTINLSHDLVSLGIANQNLTPNQPSLDARPLFQAAIVYARAHSTKTITADKGAYYFLTPQLSDRYLVFSNLNNITIDLQGSDLYLAQSHLMGLDVHDGTNLTLANFTIDYTQLPFTQVRVTSVNPAGRTIQYTPLPNYQLPSAFNTVRNPYGQPEPLYIFAFRNGQPAPNTSRFTAQRPLTDQSAQIVTDNLSWTQTANLAAIQPGDTLVISARAGQSPVEIESGTNLTLTHIDIYSSGDPGLSVANVSGTVIDHVRVIPRPGTDRLVSTNADGITLPQPQANNTVRFCVVTRTLDDGLSPHVLNLATVVTQPDSTHLTVTRNAFLTFANGQAVSFINPATAVTIPGPHITAQSPDPSVAAVFNGTVSLTFDAPLPTLPAGYPMIAADPSYRGSGLVLQNNLVQDVLFARGISLWGLMNTQLTGNLVRRTSWGGIFAYQQLSTRDWIDGPNESVTIQYNAIEKTSQSVSSPAFMAGIQFVSLDQNDNAVTSTPNDNDRVLNNYIADAGASASIRIENVATGAVQNNLLVRNPNVAIIVNNSTGITNTGNTTEAATVALTITSAATQAESPIPPGSYAVATGTNLASGTYSVGLAPLSTSLGGITVFITDSSGAQFQALLSYVSPTSINFQLPLFPLTPGAALITVASASGPVARGAILIDPAAPSLSAIGPPGIAVVADAGNGLIIVTATSDASWTAVSNVSWIQITGIANGQIAYTVAANTGSSSRTGTITIGGLTFLVTQAGTFFGPASATPAFGAGTTQTLSVTFSDPRSFPDLTILNILINNFLDGRSACYLAYSQQLNVLYLVGDDGGTLLGGLSMSTNGAISNSQCKVSWDSSAVSRVPPNNLTLTLTITYTAAFAGNKIVYTAARDNEGDNSGWHALGVWQVPGASPTTTTSVVGMTPANGTGFTATPFTFTFSDTKGFQDLGVENILVNSSLDGRHACYLAYARSLNVLYLVNDNGDALLAGQSLASAGTTSNSQCTVTWGSAPVNATANSLALTLTIAFNPSFSGNQIFYLAARDTNDGNNTGWQSMGTWAVQ